MSDFCSAQFPPTQTRSGDRGSRRLTQERRSATPQLNTIMPVSTNAKLETCARGKE